MSEETHPPRPLPASADFPVVWPSPEDAQRYWTRDRMHRPDPMAPMELSVDRLFGGDSETRVINGYLFSESKPKPPPTPEEEEEARTREVEQRAQMGRLMEMWQEETLPEIMAHMAFWDDFDLQSASMEQLMAHWEESKERFQKIWKLHRIVGPAKMAIGLLDEFYQDIFGNENGFAAYELLLGLENRTTALGRDLWHLSRQALADEALSQTLASGDWPQIQGRLAATGAGREFLTGFQAYLADHGRRSDKFGLASPSWLEDPTPVLETLRTHMRQTKRDLDREMADLAQTREARIGAVRQKLTDYPIAVREEFEWLLRAAQAGNVVGEDHNYWIDFASFYVLRRVLLEFGRRLTQAGVLDSAQDMLYLDLVDLLELAGQLPQVTAEMARQTMVVQRKAEWTEWARMNGPATLGTPPPPEPAPDSLAHRTFQQKFLGGEVKVSHDPSLLLGHAGSPGMVQGVARVVRSLAEAADLQPHEILVTVTTAPAWTPLFAIAAAIVTDTGGILSHCAVVAREYGIPAVVGTGSASHTIRSGQLIQVDGHTGTVRLLQEAG